MYLHSNSSTQKYSIKYFEYTHIIIFKYVIRIHLKSRQHEDNSFFENYKSTSLTEHPIFQWMVSKPNRSFSVFIFTRNLG